MEICSKSTKSTEALLKEAAEVKDQILKSLSSHPPIVIKNATGEHVFEFVGCAEEGGEVYRCSCGCNEVRIFGGPSKNKDHHGPMRGRRRPDQV